MGAEGPSPHKRGGGAVGARGRKGQGSWRVEGPGQIPQGGLGGGVRRRPPELCVQQRVPVEHQRLQVHQAAHLRGQAF